MDELVRWTDSSIGLTGWGWWAFALILLAYITRIDRNDDR